LAFDRSFQLEKKKKQTKNKQTNKTKQNKTKQTTKTKQNNACNGAAF